MKRSAGVRVERASLGRSDVEAVVVTFDSASVLPPCLAALARNGVPALVVDNRSLDGSAELAERHGARVIRNARNEGYGRANNIGARAVSADWLLVVNPDVELEPGAVEELRRAASRYPDAGLFAPRLVEPDGRIFFQARSLLAPYLPNPRGRPVRPDGDCCAPFLSGACFMVRRELFLELGGFDENVFLFYEDDDLCRRIADTGRALVHVDGSVARHLRGRSVAARPGRILTVRWHIAWSRAYIARKYRLPGTVLRTLTVGALKTAAAVLTFRRPVIERHLGSAAGAWAFLRGRTALHREGLTGPIWPPKAGEER